MRRNFQKEYKQGIDNITLDTQQKASLKKQILSKYNVATNDLKDSTTIYTIIPKRSHFFTRRLLPISASLLAIVSIIFIASTLQQTNAPITQPPAILIPTTQPTNQPIGQPNEQSTGESTSIISIIDNSDPSLAIEKMKQGQIAVSYPQFIYADNTFVYLWHVFGLLIFNVKENQIVDALDVQEYGINHMQGSNSTNIYVSNDGSMITFYNLEQTDGATSYRYDVTHKKLYEEYWMREPNTDTLFHDYKNMSTDSDLLNDWLQQHSPSLPWDYAETSDGIRYFCTINEELTTFDNPNEEMLYLQIISYEMNEDGEHCEKVIYSVFGSEDMTRESFSFVE